MNVTLADTILTGMNNPECAFFVGSFMGEYKSFYSIILIIGLFIVYKAVDRLAVDPLLNWVKKKLFKGGEDR